MNKITCICLGVRNMEKGIKFYIFLGVVHETYRIIRGIIEWGK